MSYILDALKRAERERKQGQVSVLDEITTTQPAAEQKRRLPAWLVPAILAVVVLALLLYTLMAWRRHGKDASVASVPLPAPTQIAAAGNVQPPPRPAPPPVAAPHDVPPTQAATIEDGGKIATLDDVSEAPHPPPPGDQPPPDQAAGRAPPPDQQMRPPPGPPPGGEPPQMRRSPRPPVVTVPSDGSAPDGTVASAGTAPPPPVDDSTANNAANAAIADVPPPPTSAQDQVQQGPPQQRQLREMPENFRANFPAFSVDVHAYNSNPQRRFVLIGGKRYHEGDTLAEGPRIIGIVPEGLVLDWQGQQVLYAISH